MWLQLCPRRSIVNIRIKGGCATANVAVKEIAAGMSYDGFVLRQGQEDNISWEEAPAPTNSTSLC